jgi:lipopolysaccharide transport system permease protein
MMSFYRHFLKVRQVGFNPLAPFTEVFRHRTLLRRVSEQDLSARYKESFLGPLWAVLVPLAQLVVFTFVFGRIIPSRWAGANQGVMDLPLNLFAGIIVHTVFAEVVTRSTAVLSENTAYIKRVVFPIQILPVSIIVTACVNMLVSLVLLVLAIAFVHSTFPIASALMAVVILLPLMIMLCGIAWLVSATAVYLPDFRHAVSPVVSLLMFLSPVLFPVSSIPEDYRVFVYLNPITVPVEELRAVIIRGEAPDFGIVSQYAAIALLIAWVGYVWFAVLRRGFADVV